MGDTELFVLAAVAVGLLYGTQRSKNGSGGSKTGGWKEIRSSTGTADGTIVTGLRTTFGPDTWDMESALSSISGEWDYQTASATGTVSVEQA